MKTPQVTVILTTNGNIRSCKESIENILSQTMRDFELYIITNNLENKSYRLTEVFRDSRIKTFSGLQGTIDSLNTILKISKGEYITHISPEDKLLPTHLSIQTEYMNTNSNVDLLATEWCESSANQNYQTLINASSHIYAIEDFIGGCEISCSNVIIRKSSIENFRYDKNYTTVADYKLWVDMIAAGLVFHKIPQKTLYHNSFKGDVSMETERHNKLLRQLQNEICDFVLKRENKAFENHISIPTSLNRLTALIAFLNEGEEVANTVKSIRQTAGDNIDIIVINDNSTDGYPYRESLSDYNVRYFENEFRLGAALSKEKAVKLCQTNYFILLDAHMRFYTQDWHKILIAKLEDNPERILCCGSKPLEKNGKGVIESSIHIQTFGAYLTFDVSDYIPGIKWATKRLTNEFGLDNNQVPAVLGAGYVSSKAYWNKLGGLCGLRHYGCEEAFISLKAWIEGGGCVIVPQITIGHIYRKKPPYKVHYSQYVYNYLVILYLIFPSDLIRLGFSISEKKDRVSHHIALTILAHNKKYLDSIRKSLREFRKKGIMEVLKMNLRYCDFHKDLSYIRVLDHRMPEILNYIKKGYADISETGLYDGLAGFLVVYTYLQDYEDVDLQKIFERSLTSILSSVNKKNLSYSIKHGLSGIGWALIYFMSNSGKELKYVSLLNSIDRFLSEVSPKRISDYSISEGLMGILCYVSARMSFCKANKIKHSLNPDFINELLNTVQANFVETNSVLRRDCWISSIEAEFDMYADETNVIRIEDIINTSPFVPKNRERWTMTLSGTLGTVIKYLELYHEKKHI